jgi:hypothetical protein
MMAQCLRIRRKVMQELGFKGMGENAATHEATVSFPETTTQASKPANNCHLM